MTLSKTLDLYLRYNRLFTPVTIAVTAILWVLCGQTVAISVMLALVVTDMVLLATATFRSIKGGKK